MAMRHGVTSAINIETPQEAWLNRLAYQQAVQEMEQEDALARERLRQEGETRRAQIQTETMRDVQGTPESRAQAEALTAGTFGERGALQQDLLSAQLAGRRGIAELQAGTQRDVAGMQAGTQRDVARMQAGAQRDIAGIQQAIAEMREVAASERAAEQQQFREAQQERGYIHAEDMARLNAQIEDATARGDQKRAVELLNEQARLQAEAEARRDPIQGMLGNIREKLEMGMPLSPAEQQVWNAKVGAPTGSPGVVDVEGTDVIDQAVLLGELLAPPEGRPSPLGGIVADLDQSLSRLELQRGWSGALAGLGAYAMGEGDKIEPATVQTTMESRQKIQELKSRLIKMGYAPRAADIAVSGYVRRKYPESSEIILGMD